MDTKQISKESLIELQKIDCNCNDCKFLERDLVAYNHSKTLHHLWQRQYFDMQQRKKVAKAEEWLNRNEWEKALSLIQEVNSEKFAFTNDAHISFGECIKLIKPVSFIPNTLQLDTQNCFKHRRG